MSIVVAVDGSVPADMMSLELLRSKVVAVRSSRSGPVLLERRDACDNGK